MRYREKLYHTKEIKGTKTNSRSICLAIGLYHTKEIKGTKTCKIALT